ncbi:hypothetical protein ACFV0C_12735 [Streptomyces sp. NPDC059568]|uniref:hypothetical protein n=1 Tax=Streptomyces sp. NPDC059568 TaxID=3346868 RepID=UPI003697F425
MRFTQDDVVLRVQLNLEQASTADAALHTWLPLVAELRPLAMEFEAAHPDGLRRGFLADLLVVSPLADAPETAGTPADQLRASIGPLAERLGLDPAAFEIDENGAGGMVSARSGSEDKGGTPYGAHLLLARIGADPLNPEGEEADYQETGENLI